MERSIPVQTWLALMALTVLTGIAAGVSGPVPPGHPALLMLAAVTIAKARLILSRYLRLSDAPAYLRGFTAGVALTVLIVVITFIVVSPP